MPPHAREVGQLWREINDRIHDRFRQAFEGYDLPMVALLFLKHINQHPGVTVSELGRRSRMAKSYVSRTIDRLSHLGYVKSRDDEADQRLKRLYLSKPAADRIAEMEAQSVAVWTELLAELPEDKIAEMIQGLRTLLKALERRT